MQLVDDGEEERAADGEQQIRKQKQRKAEILLEQRAEKKWVLNSEIPNFRFKKAVDFVLI